MDAAPPLGTASKCRTCGKKSRRVFAAAAMYGGYKACGNFKNQEVALGQKFSTVKEIDAYCRKNGLEHIGNTIPREWREIRKRRETHGY